MATKPMTNEDLVRRLRGLAEAAVTAAGSRATFVSDMHFEAADRIEKLDAVAKELLEALEAIMKPYDGAFGKSAHLSGCDLETVSKAFAAIAKARSQEDA